MVAALGITRANTWTASFTAPPLNPAWNVLNFILSWVYPGISAGEFCDISIEQPMKTSHKTHS